MLSLFLAGRSTFLLDCMLNVVDVRDVAAGIILAAERGRSGERYILGGENFALREFLRLLESTSGRHTPWRSLPAPLALAIAAAAEWIADHLTRREPPATWEGVRLALRSVPIDSRKARLGLGYAPRPIQRALSETVQWLSTISPPATGTIDKLWESGRRVSGVGREKRPGGLR
jgi:dihydroflavonol-4-reductase